jgi:hypothetical protein
VRSGVDYDCRTRLLARNVLDAVHLRPVAVDDVLAAVAVFVDRPTHPVGEVNAGAVVIHDGGLGQKETIDMLSIRALPADALKGAHDLAGRITSY